MSNKGKYVLFVVKFGSWQFGSLKQLELEKAILCCMVHNENPGVRNRNLNNFKIRDKSQPWNQSVPGKMGIQQDNNNLIKAALREQWGKFHRIIKDKISKWKVISYGGIGSDLYWNTFCLFIIYF